MAVIYSKGKKNTPFMIPRSNNLSISIITPTFRGDCMENIFSNYLRQNHDKKEMIIILNNNSLDIEYYKKKAREYSNIKVLQMDENSTLGECRNYGINHSNMNYIAMFDDDDYYSPNYLSQAVDTFKTVDCDIVGKLTAFVYFESLKSLGIWNWNMYENKYSPGVMDSSLVFNRNILKKVAIPNIQYPELSVFQNNCLNYGIKIYSTDRFNYVFHRHPQSQIQHTWNKKEEEFLRESKIIKRDVVDYSKYVIR